MSIELDVTGRGFRVGYFVDQYGEPCSIQKSSLADENCIWLGIERPEDNVGNRMHLTREMVAGLLPHLQKFVAEGEL